MERSTETTMKSVDRYRYEPHAGASPHGAGRRGFSLLEVVIAMAIMSVALFAAAGNIMSLNQAHAAQREEAAVQVIANQIIERIMGATFAQLGQSIAPTIQADQNAWSWQRRATPLPAAAAIAFGQVTGGIAWTTPVNPPMAEYGSAAQYATQDLVQLGIEGSQSGISNLRVYVEYYSMNIMNDLLAYQIAAIASPAAAMTQRTAWMAEVGNIYATDPTTSTPTFPTSCIPTPYLGANIFFPESATGTLSTQINLLQPAVPTTSQNDAVLVRVLVFWVSQAKGERWHEVWVVRRN